MTLLSDEKSLAGGDGTQALLVQTYLRRVRRRPVPPGVRMLDSVEPLDPFGEADRHPGAEQSGSPAASALAAIDPPRTADGSLVRRLPSPPPAANPLAVQTALAFIDSRAAEPIGLTEIAAAARLSPRALQTAFRRHLGTTPLGHLRAVRMARVHADLLAARPGDGQTVSTLANRWGVSQLSRFARDYRRRYGVVPRETLARSES